MNQISDIAQFMSARDQFARHLGIELLELRLGYSRVRLDLKPHMVNGLGMPHGAVIFALADYAFATACNSYGRTAVALSMDIHFIASPQVGACLTAEAVEVRSSRRTGLYRVMVFDDEANQVAEIHGMAYIKDKGFLEAFKEANNEPSTTDK